MDLSRTFPADHGTLGAAQESVGSNAIFNVFVDVPVVAMLFIVVSIVSTHLPAKRNSFPVSTPGNLPA